MLVKYSYIKHSLAAAFFLIILVSCERELPDNCEGRYILKVPYNTSHPTGRLKMGDTLTFHLEIPFNVYNYYSDSIVNITRFKNLLCGFTVSELLADTSNPIGTKSLGAKQEFFYNSPSVKLDFTEGVGGRNRVRFYLLKTDSSFVATINLIPKRKGFFYINLLNGIIEDAFCIANIEAYLGNFTTDQLVDNYLFILDKFEIHRPDSSFDIARNSFTSYCLIVD